MTELLRPALYGAYHRIEPVKPRPGARAPARSSGRSARAATSSAGTGELPPLEVGDLVAVFDTGAYGSAMSSTYNRRPLPCEVMVDDGTLDDRPAAPDDRRDDGAGNVIGWRLATGGWRRQPAEAASRESQAGLTEP